VAVGAAPKLPGSRVTSIGRFSCRRKWARCPPVVEPISIIMARFCSSALFIQPSARLGMRSKLTVGDQVDIAYEEALAVSVEPMK